MARWFTVRTRRVPTLAVRTTIAVATAALALAAAPRHAAVGTPLTAPPASSAAAPFDQSARTIDALLALDRPIVLAHAGGEGEFPGSTMFAFRRSAAAGVDMLDLNVMLTADGVLAVQHDVDVDRQTNGRGAVAAMTFDELHTLDNAYWFSTECGPCRDRPVADYLYRGIRTGESAPPAGFVADDFAIPRLEDLLDAFPTIPLGIEIKADGEAGLATADALIDLLRRRGRLDAVVISSFSDPVVAHVHDLAPDVDVSPGVDAVTAFLVDGTPLPDGQRIVQPPPIPADKVTAMHEAGYDVWVWPNDRELEKQAAYETLLSDGFDGLNIDYPAAGIAAVGQFLNGA